jgi:hypothetical protein
MNSVYSGNHSVKTVASAAVAVGIAIVITVGGALVGQLLLAPLLPAPTGGPEQQALARLTYLIAGFGPVTLLMLVYCFWQERRNLLIDVSRDWRWVRHLAIGAAFGSLLVLLPVTAGVLIGRLSVEIAGWQSTLLIVVGLALAGLSFQTFAEELVFRGWLLHTLMPRFGPIIAIAVSASAFAVTHLLNGDVTFTYVISLLLAGILLGILTVWTGSIWAAAAGHAMWNWTQFAGTAFVPEDVPNSALAVVIPVTGALPAQGNIEAWAMFPACAILLLVVAWIFYFQSMKGKR